MPTKEEILKWYQSLGQTLQQVGLDINNPADLMRIKCIDYSENSQNPGMINCADGDFSFAFMRKKVNPNGTELTEYENDEPQFSQIDQNDTFPIIASEKPTALQKREDAWAELDKARSRANNPETIEAHKKKYEDSKLEAINAAKKERQNMYDLFSVRDKWMVENTTLFDPDKEDDFAQIEHLYNKAKEGALMITDPMNSSSRQQILVSKSGNMTLGPNFSRFHLNLLSYNNLLKRNFEQQDIDDFQKKYGVNLADVDYGRVKELPPRPAKPVPAPKPGAKAWFLRIISFNQYKPEFTAYEKYQRDLAAEKKYDTDLAEARSHNQQIYQKIEKVLDGQYKEFYGADVDNPTKLSAMFHLYENILFDNGANAHPEKGRLNPDFYRGMHQHELLFVDELKNSPDSFEPDGTRKEAESEKYWAKKKASDPAAIKSNKKLAEREFAGLKQDRENSIRAKAEQYKTAFSQKHEKKEDYLASFPWAEADMEALFTNIGKIYGKDAGFGAGIFANLCTANQAYDLDGNLRPTDDVVSDENVLNGITKFFIVATNAKKIGSDSEIKEYAEMMLDHFSPQNRKTPPAERIVDSLASILASATRAEQKMPPKPAETQDVYKTELQANIYTEIDNPENIKFTHNTDPTKQTIPVALSALLMSKFVSKSKTLDISKPIENKDGMDISITTPEQRKEMLAFADHCTAISKGHKFLQDEIATKARIAESKRIREQRAKNNSAPGLKG